MSTLQLHDRVAVVTGATGGWGRGAAFALAGQHAGVIVNARTEAAISEFVAAIAEGGGEAFGGSVTSTAWTAPDRSCETRLRHSAGSTCW